MARWSLALNQQNGSLIYSYDMVNDGERTYPSDHIVCIFDPLKK